MATPRIDNNGRQSVKVTVKKSGQSDSRENSSIQDLDIQSKVSVQEADKARELNIRRRQFRMSQLSNRRDVVSSGPLQGVAAEVLPEDLNTEQQSGTKNLMSGIRNERRQPGAEQLKRKLEYRRQRQNNSVMVNQSFSGGDELAADMDGMLSNNDSPEEDNSEGENDSEPLNVPEDQEQDKEQQLADQRNQSRKDQQSGDDKSGSAQDFSLIQKIQIEVDTHRRRIKEMDEGIAGLRRTMVTLLVVLGVALGKDIFDIAAEALSVGVWSWFDWLLDLPLIIAAFVLKIEKDNKEKVEGWMISLLEIIPFIDVLPAWTGRVFKSIIQRNREIADAVRTKKKEQKKLDNALKFRQALLNLPEENK